MDMLRTGAMAGLAVMLAKRRVGIAFDGVWGQQDLCDRGVIMAFHTGQGPFAGKFWPNGRSRCRLGAQWRRAEQEQ